MTKNKQRLLAGSLGLIAAGAIAGGLQSNNLFQDPKFVAALSQVLNSWALKSGQIPPAQSWIVPKTHYDSCQALIADVEGRVFSQFPLKPADSVAGTTVCSDNPMFRFAKTLYVKPTSPGGPYTGSGSSSLRAANGIDYGMLRSSILQISTSGLPSDNTVLNFTQALSLGKVGNAVRHLGWYNETLGCVGAESALVLDILMGNALSSVAQADMSDGERAVCAKGLFQLGLNTFDLVRTSGMSLTQLALTANIDIFTPLLSANDPLCAFGIWVRDSADGNLAQLMSSKCITTGFSGKKGAPPPPFPNVDTHFFLDGFLGDFRDPLNFGSGGCSLLFLSKHQFHCYNDVACSTGGDPTMIEGMRLRGLAMHGTINAAGYSSNWKSPSTRNGLFNFNGAPAGTPQGSGFLGANSFGAGALSMSGILNAPPIRGLFGAPLGQSLRLICASGHAIGGPAQDDRTASPPSLVDGGVCGLMGFSGFSGLAGSFNSCYAQTTSGGSSSSDGDSSPVMDPSCMVSDGDGGSGDEPAAGASGGDSGDSNNGNGFSNDAIKTDPNISPAQTNDPATRSSLAAAATIAAAGFLADLAKVLSDPDVSARAAEIGPTALVSAITDTLAAGVTYVTGLYNDSRHLQGYSMTDNGGGEHALVDVKVFQVEGTQAAADVGAHEMMHGFLERIGISSDNDEHHAIMDRVGSAHARDGYIDDGCRHGNPDGGPRSRPGNGCTMGNVALSMQQQFEQCMQNAQAATLQQGHPSSNGPGVSNPTNTDPNPGSAGSVSGTVGPCKFHYGDSAEGYYDAYPKGANLCMAMTCRDDSPCTCPQSCAKSAQGNSCLGSYQAGSGPNGSGYNSNSPGSRNANAINCGEGSIANTSGYGCSPLGGGGSGPPGSGGPPGTGQ